MIEQQLQIFIDSIVNYFNYTDTPSVKVGSPYLIKAINEVRADYTGIISISGSHEGVCYFSAPSILVRHLIMSFGEDDTSEDMMLDAVGEVANTLSGNARKELGSEFIISVPQVVKGTPRMLRQRKTDRMYAIPISWKSYKAILGVGLAH